MSTALIIPSAGSGKRLGLGRPKALAEVAGTTLIRQTLTRFTRISEISEAIVVAPPGFIPEFQEALTGLVWSGCEMRVVSGAASRQESVRCGLEALDDRPELVCVHDAARPLVARETIQAVLDEARTTGSCTAASRPSDSVREDAEDGTTRPLDRTKLWLVETPQAFEYELLRRAHEHAKATGIKATDDATLVERCTERSVAIVVSTGMNLKVTTGDDLKTVRLILGQR